MKQPGSVKSLENLGRVRLSKNFFMRDFLYSEIANFYGVQNFPDDPDLAIAAGTRLCEELLEPLQARFGRTSIRSAYRSCAVNELGNAKGHNCASNTANYAGHIWDRRDSQGHMGATACIVVNNFIDYYEQTGRWEALAWWIHDHLPYSEMEFFKTYAAFNLSWHEVPARKITSWIQPGNRVLTQPGDADSGRDHAAEYAQFLASLAG